MRKYVMVFFSILFALASSLCALYVQAEDDPSCEVLKAGAGFYAAQSPWSEENPQCWMTKDHVRYATFPGISSNGGFIPRLVDQTLSNRQGNICSDGQCYGLYESANMYSIGQSAGGWLEKEVSQDFTELLGNFNSNKRTAPVKYNFVNSILTEGSKLRFYYSSLNTALGAMISPVSSDDYYGIIRPALSDTISIPEIADSGVNVALNSDFGNYRTLNDLLIRIRMVTQLASSCYDNYDPVLTLSEQTRIDALDDEGIAKEAGKPVSYPDVDISASRTVSTVDTTSGEVVSETEDLEDEGCSMGFQFSDPKYVWNGMRTMQYYFGNLQASIDTVQNSNTTAANIDEFRVYSSATKCLLGTMQKLYARQGKWYSNQVMGIPGYRGWAADNNEFWFYGGSSDNPCEALMTENDGSHYKADVYRIFNRYIPKDVEPLLDPAPGILRSLLEVLSVLEKQVAAQLGISVSKTGMQYLNSLDTTNTYKLRLMDADSAAYPQLAYLYQDKRDDVSDTSTCVLEPYKGNLNDNTLNGEYVSDSYESLQKDMVAKVVNFSMGNPYVGFDNSFYQPGSFEVYDEPPATANVNGVGRAVLMDATKPSTLKKVIPGSKQVTFLSNGKFFRYAEFCTSYIPDASTVLTPPGSPTDIPQVHVKIIPRYYKVLRKAQAQTKELFKKRYKEYLRSTMRFAMRRAMLSYQLKSSVLKTIPLKRKVNTASSVCYFSLSSMLDTASRWRMIPYKDQLTSLLALNKYDNAQTNITAMIPNDYVVMPYQAFLENVTDSPLSRELDTLRDMAFELNADVYRKYLTYKLNESMLLYASVSYTLGRDGPIEMLDYALESNYRQPLQTFYRGMEPTADPSEGESGAPMATDNNDDEKDVLQGSPDQEGNSSICIEDR